MFPDHFKIMAAYNRWANTLLYDACAGLTDAARKQDRRAFFGSIHNTLNHILVGDRAWLARIKGFDADNHPLDSVLFDDFGKLRSARATEDDRIEHILMEMDDERMESDLHYYNIAGTPFRTPMHLVFTHMFNHQTHHRGQIHDMLSQTGVSPPKLDLIYYVRTL